MLSRVHNKLGTAGLVVAVVALVAALTGAAFAAGGLTKKQEKQVIKIAKKYAGKNGKDGAAGPAGPKGDTGAKGDTGTQGKEGPEGQQGQAGRCSEGNPECTLAGGGLLTGIYSVAVGEAETSGVANISLPLRVSPPPIALYGLEEGGITVGIQLENPGEGQFTSGIPNSSISVYGTNATTPVGVFGELAQAEAAWQEKCEGSFATPDAASGFLCIYPGRHQGKLFGPNFGSTNTEAPHEFGITVPYSFGTAAGGGTGNVAIEIGSWAVGG
ncbi:MAG: hypothetical protein ACJ76D_10435 [Solirubrobacterales bacterium]